MSSLLEELPDTLRSVKTKPLFVLRLTVPKAHNLGSTPGGGRLLAVVSGGTFEGERLSGQVLDGGNDWFGLRSDASALLDVRLVLKTSDDALVGMTYRGLRHGPAEVMARIGRGEAVDPQSYYFRISATFETASETYGWLNRIVAIGVGHRLPQGPIYSVFEVL